MLAAPADRLPAALAQLDPGSRALLDLSLRRGISDAEIGELLRKDAEDVARGRGEVLDLLADALEVDGDDRRERVRESLLALPDEAWQPPRPAPDEPPRPAAPPPREVARPSQPRPRPHLRAQEESYVTPDEPRRSRVGPILALLGLIGVIALITALVLNGGGDDGSGEPKQPAQQRGKPPAASGDERPPPDEGKRSATLRPLAGSQGSGKITLNGDRDRLDVRISGLPRPAGSYEIWLYSSIVEAQSLGSFRDTKIELDARLPDDPEKYRYVDVSLEPADGNSNHSGDSVLRAPVENLIVE